MHTSKSIEELSLRFSWLFLLIIVFTVVALSYLWQAVLYSDLLISISSLLIIFIVYGLIVYLFNILYKKEYKRDKDFLIMFSGFMLGFPNAFVCFILLTLGFITLDPLFILFSLAWSLLAYPFSFVYGFFLSSFLNQ